MKAGASKDSSGWRIYAVIFLFTASFAGILYRAFTLQVLDVKGLKKVAASQHKKTLAVQSKRGGIFDRNSNELAISMEVDSVYAEPDRVLEPKRAARELGRVLNAAVPDMEKRLKSGKGFVWLRRQVDLSAGERERVLSIEGVGIIKESRRYYPNRQLASNLLGFTGLDASGLEGVERRYDGILKGSFEKVVGDKDAKGRLLMFEDVGKKVPVRGAEIELTIDKTIQYVAEKALKGAVSASSAKGGTVIVMNPATGEVLAMASMPTFDPNDVAAFEPRQWRNRAITDAIEPGSVLKLFLISAALEENAVKPWDRFYCENGSYRVSDRVFHDVKKHGWLTPPQIIKYSSNIGSAKIGERLGRPRLYRYLKAFGFGTKTGIDLPGESEGSLRHFKRWNSVTLQTVSFGQGISTTPLQLVTALSAIANNGFIMKPYIVKGKRDAATGVSDETTPVIVRRVVSEKTAQRITDMMTGVTEEGGTGTMAAVEGFRVAGKTGTAQKADLKRGGYLEKAYTSAFFGFVPAKSPRLAIIVIIDEPKGNHHGGTVAAPAFKEIAEQGLSYLGVYPDNQTTASPGRMTRRPETARMNAALKHDALAKTLGPGEGKGVPDFTGKTLRAALQMARESSIELNAIGGGRAIYQKPDPGAGGAGGGWVAGAARGQTRQVTVWFE